MHSLGLSILLLVAPVPAPTTPNAAKNEAPTPPAPSTLPDVATHPTLGDTPPPSTYDRMMQREGKEPTAEPSMVAQLVRTILALMFVIALIYIIAKVGILRWLKPVGSKSGSLKVVERLQLDAKNSLVWVETARERLLLGLAHDGGVSVVTREDVQKPTEAT